MLRPRTQVRVLGPLILCSFNSSSRAPGTLVVPDEPLNSKSGTAEAWRKRTELLQAQRGDHRRSLGNCGDYDLWSERIIAEPKFVSGGMV